MNHDIREKKNSDEKKQKKTNRKKPYSTLRHVGTDFRSMMSEVRLNSFMTDIFIIKKPDLQSESMDWFLYDRDLCHERVNGLLIVCIHLYVFMYIYIP